jgi:hypothetical protein
LEVRRKIRDTEIGNGGRSGPDEKRNAVRVGIVPGHLDVEVPVKDRYGALVICEEGAVGSLF